MNAYIDKRYRDNRAERFFNLAITVVAVLAISMVAVNG